MPEAGVGALSRCGIEGSPVLNKVFTVVVLLDREDYALYASTRQDAKRGAKVDMIDTGVEINLWSDAPQFAS